MAAATPAGPRAQDPSPLPQADKPPAASPRTSIRVATYNINWGNAGLAAVLSAIQQADADLVCLQETNDQSAAALQRAFAADYPYLRFYGSVEPYLAGGFAILSRLPVTREDFVPPRHGLFGTCLLEITIGAQRAQVICVHLQPVMFHNRDGNVTPLSVLAALEAAEQTHRQEMLEILTHVRTDVPVLIIGDFNSCSTFQAPALLVERGFVDSFAAVNENPDTHPTWHWPTKFGDAMLRIDYIFHSPPFRTLKSRIVPSEGSDHFLLVSEVEIRA